MAGRFSLDPTFAVGLLAAGALLSCSAATRWRSDEDAGAIDGGTDDGGSPSRDGGGDGDADVDDDEAEEADVCRRDCDGRACGPDGCGGACGSCPDGDSCDEVTGTCRSCEPECVGRACGGDGCGGACGECPEAQTCLDTEGLCLEGAWSLVPGVTTTVGEVLPSTDRFCDPVPARRITVSRDLLMQSTEVTREQVLAAFGYDPADMVGDPWSEPACGVEGVAGGMSWHAAAAYCNALSDRYGLARCYECDGTPPEVECVAAPELIHPADCRGFRLPTEVEWEVAARAGTSTDTYNGDVDGCEVHEPIARTGCNTGTGPVEPRTRAPNDLGLYDMLGNVWEWCHDGYVADPPEGVDPAVPATGPERVVRGGGWATRLTCRATAWHRFQGDPALRLPIVGFRPVVTLVRRER